MAAKDLGLCWVDGKDRAREMHHVLPVEVGGPMDGRLVPLCGNHHTEIHDAARALLKGEMPLVYTHPRVGTLANYIVQQTRIFEESGEPAADARNMMQVSFDAAHLSMAHDLKRQMGMRSLERMVIVLIEQEWLRRRSGNPSSGRS